MEDRKRRTRTGCLTCRARRVKCDEQKPTCQRCKTANVECTGYEGKRRIEPPQRRRTSQREDCCHSPAPAAPPTATPAFRPDGLPLIGLPSSPAMYQRPHARARDLLSYHQYLFRTLGILFPEQHLRFWRDCICEALWETGWVFDAVIALGGIHRAVLMLSQPGELDRNRGMDTKVIAVQAYTRALQGLAEGLGRAEEAMGVLVGGLVILAYFECFNGNVPAALRHVRVAERYYQGMCADAPLHGGAVMEPVGHALRELQVMSDMILPHLHLVDVQLPTLPAEGATTDQVHPTSETNTHLEGLQQLLDIVAGDPDIKGLLWTPCNPYLSSNHETSSLRWRVLGLLEQVSAWAANNQPLFHRLSIERWIVKLQNLTYKTTTTYTLPPEPILGISEEECILLEVYTFFKARLTWALSIMEDDSSSHELEAYHYLYQHLQIIATMLERNLEPTKECQIRTCERLKIGLAPMLYILGHCCPNPIWLRWIISALEETSSHGLFDSDACATSLHILLTLEKTAPVARTQNVVRYPRPSRRVISVLYPRRDGKGYTVYYAGTRDSVHGNSGIAHCPLGAASWFNTARRDEIELELFDDKQPEIFDINWLMAQPAMRNWRDWMQGSKFNLDMALADHISGTRLIHDVDDMATA
ncbi:hypothetical protein BJY04DRAFT_218922 [Aspergillus karnatakaensis]|uniref:Zn(II)2Cys6 transcription factor domain-containing protein n=1 Tax=Aspergillus karnatakaensis TaxID=1810916 RepID=UPI003CCDA185